MDVITININNPNLTDKVIWFLKRLEADGLEIISKEDIQDLKALKATRVEESISFSDYMKNENQDTNKSEQDKYTVWCTAARDL